MMIAVVLSSNIRRMIRDQVLVRKPVGIEAAGSMNLLFTDKTGTLTEGKMSVSQILLGDGSRFASYGALRRSAGEAVWRGYDASCRENTAALLSEGRALGGNATEQALLLSVASETPAESWQVTGKLPFDSDRKFSAVSLRSAEKGRSLVLVKGAAERLVPSIRYAYDQKGRAISFGALSYEFSRQLHLLGAEGKRVLCLAQGDRMPVGSDMGALTLIAAVVLEDRIRPEARQSVAELQNAGIQVVMITGDHRDTAESIARSCGLIGKGRDRILTSDELSRMTDEEVMRALPSLAVIARALPSDKSRLVRLAQRTERVVGMTGDGINDAPALKRADIGFSMGTGTHVAREAGDIIILDNNLSSIAKAVLYGRNIFKSIRKFITLQLTMNFCAVGVSMIGPFVGIDAPVTVVQMLWINIIMDTLGGLAFAGEAPLPSAMREKPKRRDEPILNRYMVNQILWLGSFTIALCLGFLLLPTFSSHFRYTEGRLCHLTAFFVLFIFTSVFHCFNARTDRLRLFSGLTKNRVFMMIMGVIALVQILFVYLGGSVLRTMPLTAGELGYTLLVSLSVLPVEFCRKLFWRLRGRKEGF